VEFRILGAVEVRDGGRLLETGRPQARAVLAVLLADAGRPVTAEALIDRVWGEDPPAGARRTLHTHIASLRGMLGAAVLARQAGSYVLRVDPLQVDLHRFRDLVSRAGAAGEDSGDSGDSGDDGDGGDGRRRWLREAVYLWDGQPLAGIPGEWAARTRRAWQQEHLDAVLSWAAAEIAAGNAAAIVGRLTAVADEHPFVEPVHAAAIRALSAAGQTAAALDAYAATRARLVEELGLEPGPELRAAHELAIRATADPAGRPRRTVPAQLPAAPAVFTGRAAELAELDALLGGSTVLISAVAGTAGVGKTALALRWAHRVADRFPDGQLYVNLRGYDPDQPVDPADALAGFLTALGVAGQDIPRQPSERAARYRSETAGRSMLIVLDNAGTVEQVRPLLPGAPTCAVVVTSRDSLPGLVAVDGARRLELDLLPGGDAHALLRRLVGTRLDADPEAAHQLIGRCARLPLALRVAAEFAIAHPDLSLSELADQLADERRRLDVLDAGGDSRAAARAVFSWSVGRLPASPARLFRLLGLHPGANVDAPAAAALAGTPVDQAVRDLEALARAHLIQPAGPGRYGMHDLLRAYAAELAGELADADTALTRLFDYYRSAVGAATTRWYPAEPRGPVPAARSFGTAEQALAWLDAERGTLVAVCVHAATHDRPAHAVDLAWWLFRYLETGGHNQDALRMHDHAREAAVLAGDPAGEATALYGLGVTYWREGRLDEADAHLRQSMSRCAETGARREWARARSTLGHIHLERGLLAEATDCYQPAVAAFQQVGDRQGEAITVNGLGVVRYRDGDLEQAAKYFQQSLDLHGAVGNLSGQARAVANLGGVELRRERYVSAAWCYERALELCRMAGDRTGEAYALTGLGDAHIKGGGASGYFQEALTLHRRLGDRAGEAETLNGLGETCRVAGRPADAVAYHAAALALATETGRRYEEGRAHRGLGYAHTDLAEIDTARTHLRQALALYPAAEHGELHAALAALPRP
jgi:DNA-binding SARP family transcriptional activator/tetratricopeptide (TPR) repeat protein